jgi:predicted secreted protein
MTPEQGNDADLRTELAQLIEQHQADPQKLQALLQHLAQTHPGVAQILAEFAQQAEQPAPEQPAAMQYEADPHEQIHEHVHAAMQEMPPPGHDEWRAQFEHHLATDPAAQAMAQRFTQEANYDNEPGTAVAPANPSWWDRNKDTALGVGLPLAATVGGALLHHKLTKGPATASRYKPGATSEWMPTATSATDPVTGAVARGPAQQLPQRITPRAAKPYPTPAAAPPVPPRMTPAAPGGNPGNLTPALHPVTPKPTTAPAKMPLKAPRFEAPTPAAGEPGWHQAWDKALTAQSDAAVTMYGPLD